MMLLAVSIGGLMLALTNGAETGWTNLMTIIYLILSIIAFAILIPWEWQQSQPLLNFHYFTRPYFIASILTSIMGGFIVSIILFFDPLYLQAIRHDSVIKTGFVLLTIPAMIIIAPPFISRGVTRFGKLNIVIFATACATLSALFHATFTNTSPLWYLLFSFVLVGMSWAIVNILSGLTAQAAVQSDEYGSATGTSFTFFNLIAASGIAIVAAFFHFLENGYLNRQLASQKVQLPFEQLHLVRTLLSEPEKLNDLLKNFPGTNQSQIIDIFKSAFMTGFHGVMWLLCAICILILLGLLRVKFRYFARNSNSKN